MQKYFASLKSSFFFLLQLIVNNTRCKNITHKSIYIKNYQLWCIMASLPSLITFFRKKIRLILRSPHCPAVGCEQANRQSLLLQNLSTLFADWGILLCFDRDFPRPQSSFHSRRTIAFNCSSLCTWPAKKCNHQSGKENLFRGGKASNRLSEWEPTLLPLLYPLLRTGVNYSLLQTTTEKRVCVFYSIERRMSSKFCLFFLGCLFLP